MPIWRFVDYITESRANPVIEWYGTLLLPEQVGFDLLVKTLSETEDWDEPKPRKRKYKPLERDELGLTELIFNVQGGLFKKHMRPLGILKLEEREFVFLGGCEKHGLWTIPPHAFRDAMRLKLQFDEGKGATRDHPI